MKVVFVREKTEFHKQKIIKWPKGCYRGGHNINIPQKLQDNFSQIKF